MHSAYALRPTPAGFWSTLCNPGPRLTPKNSLRGQSHMAEYHCNDLKVEKGSLMRRLYFFDREESKEQIETLLTDFMKNICPINFSGSPKSICRNTSISRVNAAILPARYRPNPNPFQASASTSESCSAQDVRGVCVIEPTRETTGAQTSIDRNIAAEREIPCDQSRSLLE